MPTAMNFTSLQGDVRNYTERGGGTTDPTFATQLPSIINLVERQIARELKIQGFQAVVVSTMVINQSVYQKPDRWRETISVNVGTNTGSATTFNTRVTLLPRSYEFVRTIFPDDTVGGTPAYYADYDYDNWLIQPTSTGARPFEVLYWELPALLDDNNETNWLTDYAPNALLHGTLVESFKFLKRPEQVAEWQPAFDRDMAALSGEDLQKILDRAQERRTS